MTTSGGSVEDGDPILRYNEYIIPQSFADQWKEALDKLNKGGVE